MTETAPRPHVLLLGNPNVGKTSLWNRITGGRARVGNYPGVTVERRSGTAVVRTGDGERSFELVDVPGAYSLSARSAEEQIAMASVLGLFGPSPDALVVVLDAGQLSRCLYLTLSLLELRIPLVVALNLGDEAGAAAPSAEALAAELGVPVVATNGRTGAGTDELLLAVARVLAAPTFLPKVHVPYSEPLRRLFDDVVEALPKEMRRNVEHDRAVALWALSSIEREDELVAIPEELRRRVLEKLVDPEAFDLEVATTRYRTIDGLLERLGLAEAKAPRRTTERLDRLLLHPVFGLAIFVGVMLTLFQALFTWADPLIGWIEEGVAGMQNLLLDALPASVFRDLLVEGVVGGVGNVVVFLPQILLLFLFVGFLEDSGYMARVAYLMDRVMRALGLHGRAFVPMLSGFACAVPAILATRTLERRRDQLLTMLVIPLTTCSARLPVYSLVIAALIPVGSVGFLPVQGLLLAAMYALSLVMSLVVAWVLGRTVVRGKNVPLLLELPPYRLPRLSPTLRMMGEKSRQFLSEAGTMILGATIVLWALLAFPRQNCDEAPESTTSAVQILAEAETASPRVTDAPRRECAVSSLETSYGARLGKSLEPVLAPLGFDWKIATGIIGAFAAREVFVSTLALVYGVGDVDEEAAPLRDKIREARKPDGTPAYDAVTGLSLLVFFAFACQCMSTLAVVRRETKSVKWPLFLFAYMTALAYGASFVVYQGGRLLGF